MPSSLIIFIIILIDIVDWLMRSYFLGEELQWIIYNRKKTYVGSLLPRLCWAIFIQLFYPRRSRSIATCWWATIASPILCCCTILATKRSWSTTHTAMLNVPSQHTSPSHHRWGIALFVILLYQAKKSNMRGRKIYSQKAKRVLFHVMYKQFSTQRRMDKHTHRKNT